MNDNELQVGDLVYYNYYVDIPTWLNIGIVTDLTQNPEEYKVVWIIEYNIRYKTKTPYIHGVPYKYALSELIKI